jgi:hypothetical protein
MAKVKEEFTLFLAPWQIRMINDFLPGKLKKIEKVIIKPGIIYCPVSYKIPDMGLSRRDWILYLTDEQIRIVKDQFNSRTAITSINITEELIKNKSVVFK